MELLIVTGMSGAGKSQAANQLEDIGYYCVDNIPPKLIPAFAEMMLGNNEIEKAAVVVDVRAGEHISELSSILNKLSETGVKHKILFLDCADDVLVRRYKETRRKHPLWRAGVSLSESVKTERGLLSPISQKADYVLVTTQTSVAQMKEQLAALFLEGSHDGMDIRVMSFGFKYGFPAEADLMFDVRCLPNPFYIEELRPLTGKDKKIKDYVLKNETSSGFEKRLLDFMDYSVPLYISEGKSQLVIAVGCTGGKHRSVVFAELIGKHLKRQNYHVTVSHRDISK